MMGFIYLFFFVLWSTLPLICIYVGNRRSEECRDHPYLRPSPYMHLHGQLPGMPLLKDGRGLDINGAAADPRLNITDMCNQGKE